MIESVTASLRALTTNETAARVHRFNSAVETFTETRAKEILHQLRNTYNAAAARVTNETGAQFTIESGSFFTRFGVPIFVCAVTRVDSSPPLDIGDL